MALCQQAVLQVLSVAFLILLTAPRRGSLQHSNNSPLDLGSESSDNGGRKHAKIGYVFTLRYNGQQSAGIRSLFSQQCWVGAYNLSAYIVEPFIHDSYVQSFDVDLARQKLGLDNFFDIELLKNKTKSFGYGQLATWEEFVRSAPRKIIYIQTRVTRRWDQNNTMIPKMIWNANSKSQCYIPTQPSHNIRINFLLQNFTFCIIKVVKVYMNDNTPFNAEEFNDYILAGRKVEEITLVFDKWSGPWYVPHKQDEISVCEDAHERSLHGSLRPSRILLRQAEAYEQIHSGGRPFRVAVMIRSEHILHMLPAHGKHQQLHTCFHEGILTVNRLMEKEQPEIPFVTMDVGRYGSASFMNLRFKHALNIQRATFFRTVKMSFKRFVHDRFNFNEWQDTFSVVTDGMEDRGYIAALQRTIASRADCLVLMGGGQFIKVALHQYLDSHSRNEWCVELVCVGGRYKEDYKKIIETKFATPTQMDE